MNKSASLGAAKCTVLLTHLIPASIEATDSTQAPSAFQSETPVPRKSIFLRKNFFLISPYKMPKGTLVTFMQVHPKNIWELKHGAPLTNVGFTLTDK